MGKRVKAKTHLTNTHLDLDKDVGEIMIAVRQSNDDRDLQAIELLLSPHSHELIADSYRDEDS